MEFAPGDRVTVRGKSWIVEGTVDGADCRILRLSTTQAVRRELLLPFDWPVKATHRPLVQAITRRQWARRLQQSLSQTRGMGELLGAAGAAIDLLPFQLEPAIALLEGRASRFLLADEVGLGKTIQAGLMLAELRRRGWCERALVLTPAGLRAQWQRELRDRFDIQSTIVDAASLAGLHNVLPHEINPWSTDGVFLSSIDFIKQPEVLRSTSSELWDLLIVDEAHQVTDGSQRYAAVSLLASRARQVVLLTATPHGGDEPAYRALCNVGRIDNDDRILIFRRTRLDVAAHRLRHVHLLPVRLNPSELLMHRALDAYVSRLWQVAEGNGRHDVRLAAAVLTKRAFSSATSLALSLERRRAALAGDEPTHLQSTLPFDAEDECQDEAAVAIGPAFDQPAEELSILTGLIDLARCAATDESKLRVLLTLLRRTSEPAIVFTEYRDTVEMLAKRLQHARRIALLHGGLSPTERADAVSAFTGGAADLLLSTDAGAEGLNLHACCRLVVNLELPWRPTRLEQRIGRVDRIGQARTVHAVNLLAGRTAETDVLAALVRRIDCIQASEIEIAASVIGRVPAPSRVERVLKSEQAAHADLSQRARLEAGRLASTRQRATHPCRAGRGCVAATAIRRGRFPTIFFVRIGIASAAGRLVEDILLPLAVRANPLELAEARSRSSVRERAQEVIRIFGSSVQAIAKEVGDRRAAELEAICGQRMLQALRRERHLSQAISPTLTPRYQAGLFDHRSTRARLDAQRRSSLAAAECEQRSAFLASDARIHVVAGPSIALILLSC